MLLNLFIDVITSNKMKSYKLVYFNARGLAETSRLIFKISGVEFEDFRYPFEVLDWKTFSFIKDEFDNDKANGDLQLSMNKLPALHIDGKIMFQSKSIEKYLAREFGLMGNTPEEALMIDSLCETIRDLKSDYQPVRKAENKEEAMLKWFEDTLPEKLLMLETILQNYETNELYSVGDKLSLADIVLYQFIYEFFDDKVSILKACKNCTKLLTVARELKGNENLANWIENRPSTSF